VIVELPEWRLYLIGRATLIGCHLEIPARHVIEDTSKRFGAKPLPGGALPFRWNPSLEEFCLFASGHHGPTVDTFERERCSLVSVLSVV
jgi:hypothetical protein